MFNPGSLMAGPNIKRYQRNKKMSFYASIFVKYVMLYAEYI